MAAKDQNNGGVPPATRGGPGGYQITDGSQNLPMSDGSEGVVQNQQPGAGLPPANQQGGAYAQPLQMGPSSIVPPPVFEAPQVQERVVTGPQVDYSQYGPTLQQMEDEQLASRQLDSSLASDPPYMRQAALSGQRSAAQRGALSSSISAGASQSAAIQAAAPIALEDARAYQRIASENATAMNNNNLAKLQSATNMATSKLQSLTALASTAMDAESRGQIAALNANAQSAISQMEIQARREAQEFGAAHQRALEMLGQQGRMEIAEFQQAGAMEQLDRRFEGERGLEGLRQEGRMDLAEAQNQYALEQIDHEGSVQSYLQAQDFENSFIIENNRNIAQMMASIGMSDMDPIQQARAMQNMMSTYSAYTSSPIGGGDSGPGSTNYTGGSGNTGGTARGPGGPVQP